MLDDRSRAAVEVSERYADGLATDQERLTALRDAEAAARKAPFRARVAARAARHTLRADARNAKTAVDMAVSNGLISTRERASVIRELFGDPQHPVAPDGSWMTENAAILARTMYESRDFTAMPLLADLLEEAGCPAAVSEHCRGPGPHVRGCWVVDLLLGKE
jgi:hypothetical protein